MVMLRKLSSDGRLHSPVQVNLLFAGVSVMVKTISLPRKYVSGKLAQLHIQEIQILQKNKKTNNKQEIQMRFRVRFVD